MAKTPHGSQRDPLSALSSSFSSSTRRRKTHYRQATLSECLEALASSQASAPSPSSDPEPGPSSSSVRSSKKIKLLDSDASSRFAATSPPTTPASSPSKPPIRIKKTSKRSLAAQIESLSLHGGSRQYRHTRNYDASGYLKTLVSNDVSDVGFIEDGAQTGYHAPYAMALSHGEHFNRAELAAS